MGGLAALPRPLRPRRARRDRPTGKIGRASQGLQGLPAAWPPLAAKTKRGHTTSWYDLLIFLWSERLDSNQRPPAPKAGALPCCATLRDGMFCTQKALLWQGRPSGDRKGRCLHEGGTASCRGSPLGLLPHRAGAGCGQGRPSSPQKGAGHTCPSLRTGKEQGLIRAQAPGHGHRRERWPLFQTGNLAAEKEKPRSKAGRFPYGAKDGT